MAADSHDTQQTLEITSQETTKKIEKEIVKLTLGNARSSLHLFDITPFEDIPKANPLYAMFAKIANSDEASASNKLAQFIINRIASKDNLFQQVFSNTQENEELVGKTFAKILDPRRIRDIFDLVAEVRLERILEENMLEIERLKSFSSFLKDFVLYYPYEDSIKKTPIKTIIKATTLYKEIAKKFIDIYEKVIEFQDKAEKEDAELFKLVSEFIEFLDKVLVDLEKDTAQAEVSLKRLMGAIKTKLKDIETTLKLHEEKEVEGLSIENKKGVEVLPIDKEQVLEYLKTFYMETYDMPEDEAKLEAQAAFERYRKEKTDSSIALSIPSSSAPLPPPLTETFAYSLAAVVRVTAGSSAGLRSTTRSPADRQKVETQITKLITNISQVNEKVVQESKERLSSKAAEAAKAAEYPKATKYTLSTRKNVEEFEILHVLSALPNEKELEQFENGYILIGRRRPATARLLYLQNGKPVECDRDNLSLLCQHVSKSLGEPKTQLKLELKEQQDFIITPCGDDTFFSSREGLEGSATLHILSVLPVAKKLDQFDNGYILIGPENPGKARLYFLDKDKEPKLVECPRGDLTLLCKHVSEFQKIQLNRKEQQELIIDAGSGHDYKTASLAPAPALAQRRPSLISQSSFASSSSSGASQKKFNLEGYKIVLLKESENWPEDANIAEKTLYFKWNKPNLEVRHKLENGSVFKFERPITFPKNINLVANEFERYEKFEGIEGFEVAAEAREFLQSFAENPNPAISRRISIALPPQPVQLSQSSDVRPLSPAKEEKSEGKEKEEIKKEEREGDSNSPKKEERTPSPSKLSFHSAVVPQVQTGDTEPGASSQANLRMSGSPR